MGFYKRNLPHFQPEGHTYFITTRLAGSIPKNIYDQIKMEYEKELEKLASDENKKNRRENYSELQRNNFIKYEKILDSCKYGAKWLSDGRIANIVKNVLHLKDNKLYDLISYTIMPNHIHIILKPLVERASARYLNNSTNKGGNLSSHNSKNVVLLKYPLTEIMRLLKGGTAFQANKILKRKGNFWQHESYDHVVRDEKELLRIVKYILNNPVKAGLCKTHEEWEWNYYNSKYLI